MKISDVLRTKGSAVITVAPQETIASLLGLLAQHNIGAVVVDGHLAAIISIGDVVKARMDQLASERDLHEAYISQ